MRVNSVSWLPHRDRFGFELIQWLAEQNGGGIVVLDNTDYSPDQELTQDILAHPLQTFGYAGCTA